MTHPNPAYNPTRTSLIEGMSKYDPAKWQLFYEAYGLLLQDFARRRLYGRHRDDIDDAVQNVLCSFLKQQMERDFKYEKRESGGFRGYLYVCLWNEAHALFRRRRWISLSGEVEIDPIDEDQDEFDFTTNYYLKMLDLTINQIYTRCLLGNEIMWRCFVERVLHHRPATEVAADLGISQASVSQNATRIINEILSTSRNRYMADFRDQGLARALENRSPEQKRAAIKMMKDLCGDMLAREKAGGSAAFQEASRYFLQVLPGLLPELKHQTDQSTWAAFRQYTRSLYEGGDPVPLTQGGREVLARLDDLLREHCEADLDHRHYYLTLKKIDRDAVAILCGGPAGEALDRDEDAMS